MKSKTRLSMTVAFVVAILFAGVMLQATISEVPTGTWRSARSMSSARRGASASLLKDGRVLVAGGLDDAGAALATAEVFGTDGSFTPAQAMLLGRARHAAVTLTDGRVLVIGGETGSGVTSEIEIYDPAENQWTVAGTLLAARSGHTATLLSNGRVLIAGGEGPSAPGGVVEMFDPAGGGSIQVGALGTPRSQHVAVKLADGRVLIAGGQDSYGVILSSTEIFDLVEGVTSGPAMTEARAEATATALINGDVLIAAGRNGSDLSSAEIYSKASGAFSAAPAMTTARSGHAAFLLPGNNGVLIVGGSAATAELFLPQVRQFVSTGAPAASGAGAVGTALFQDGLLLLAGPGSASELYGFATLKTNQLDYQPGTPVVVTGSGWNPGETVHLSMVEDPTLDVHTFEPVVADEWGHIFTNQWAPDHGDLGIRFYLTATGESSEAQVTFTDAVPPDMLTSTTVTAVHLNANHVTDVQGSTIPFGSTIHDKATVFGSGATPTGSVTFDFFTNGVCMGTSAFTQTLALSGGIVDAISFAQGPLVPGAYSFRASYSGDDAYNPSTADCEPVNVAKATSTTVTEIHENGNHADVQGSTLPLGATIHDQAAVSGSAGTPTGSVSFAFYNNGACTGASVTGAAALVGGVAHATGFGQGPLGAGSYSFLASYGGDDNYKPSVGVCETVTVDKANTTTATEIHANGNHVDVQGGTLALGATIHDQATVSGSGMGAPTGSVSFAFYTNGVCSGTPAATGSAALVGGVADASGFVQGPLTAGTYGFQATYAGDANYNGSVGACEVVTVAKADTTTATAIHAGSNHTTDVQGSTLALGATIHDQATVSGSGAGAATGSVSFAFYTNGVCAGTPAATGSAALVGGVADATAFVQSALAAGSYSFKATYGGDANYNGSVGACETVAVAKGNTTTATAIHGGNNHTTDVQGSTLALGSTIHDQATVSGSGAGAATGSVSFAFYTNGVCAGTPAATGSAALAGGVADATAFVQSALAAGSYSFLATYGGDANYNGSVGACETVAVAKGNTATVTAIHAGGNHTTDVQGSNLVQGATIHDQAMVSGSGAGTPTGMVSFAFHNNGVCTGTPAATAVTGLAGGVVDAAGFAQGPLGAGSYSFRATYSGDANYNGSAGSCEPVTVIPPPTATCVSITAVQGIAITPVTMTGSGGAGGPDTFAAIGLPPGLTMSIGGTISGTPTVTGTFSYSVFTTDKDGNTGISNCSVQVQPQQICYIGTTHPQVGATQTWTVNGNGTITIRTVLSRNFVDNTYGTSAVGWPGNGHSFSQLTGSDQLTLALYDKNGVKKMEFKQDYISASTSAPSGYQSLGVAGGDGGMLAGSASDVVSATTSLDVNFNQYGYVLTTNSPATDANYTPNASYPNWIYDVWYEVTVKASAFGAAGFGQPMVSGVHASPSKTGSNTEVVTTTPCPQLSAACAASTGTVGTPYSSGIVASYGTAPYTYALASGSLPPGLTLNPTTGAITGTPTTTGAYSYAVLVTDSTGASVMTSGCGITISTVPPVQQVCYVGTAHPQVGATQTWTVNGNGTITIRTVLSRSFVDNTYGTGAVGWPGNGHSFSQLTGSDQLTLALYDMNGAKTMEFKQDYITATTVSARAPSGYQSLGVAGGDGGMLLGSASDVVSATTSLDVNFNQHGYVLTTNSPATDANYTPNAGYPNWIYDVWYEVTVKASAFGAAGFGHPVVSGVHASPSKTGSNTEVVIPTPCPQFGATCAASTGAVGTPYSSGIIASYGNAPYTYAVVSGSLPPGLTLNATTGAITGTPTTTGAFPYAVLVTDSTGASVMTSGCGITVSTVPPVQQVCYVGTAHPQVGATQTWTVNGNGTITIRTVLSRNFVDNTYGTSAVGWPGNGHSFSQLTGSDQLTLALYDKNGVKKMEFKQDYITSTAVSARAPSGYQSLGVSGGDGGMLVGSASDVVSATTSLDVNFNQYGYVLTTNSPATDANYTPNGTYPDWIYDVWYEVTVKASAFGAAGFGQPVVSGVHASPSKTGSNTEVVASTPCPQFGATCAASTGIVGVNYSSAVVGGYGIAPYSYALNSGSLPPGLTLNGTTGLISGTPTGAGSFPYTILVTDATGATALTGCGITITDPPPILIITAEKFDKAEVQITIQNVSASDVFVTGLSLSWPVENGKLKQVKLDGDMLYDSPDIPPPSATLTLADLVSDANKRKIGVNKSRVLHLVFEKNVEKDPLDYDGLLTCSAANCNLIIP